jgi:YesN/AraC family two-component response regulator
LKSLHFFSSRVLTLANPDLLLKKLHDLHSVAESSDPLAGLECSSITYGLILDLYRYGSCTDVRSKQQYFDQLAPALHLIEDRFHQALTLGDLAARLSVSPQHTCLLFQLALGIRPFEYITKVRLRKAKELLIREPALSIAEVSRKVGYDNPSYFIKMFKRNEGITPKQFRKNALGDSIAT